MKAHTVNEYTVLLINYRLFICLHFNVEMPHQANLRVSIVPAIEEDGLEVKFYLILCIAIHGLSFLARFVA
jgi:hypothetical protein